MTALMVPPTLVARLVESHMGGPFLWGVSDCCTGPANVFADLTGVDVLEGRRASYPSRVQAARDMEVAGGALVFAGRWLADMGLRHGVEAPGMLGLLKTPRGFHGAICLMAGRWAIKAKEGFSVVPAVSEIWGLA